MLLYEHKSLIRRKLGNVDLQLQENKAVNLSIAAPKVTGILIKPGETFSFWHLVGKTTVKKGYREGLTISNGKTAAGVGGGMCQFTNQTFQLLVWVADTHLCGQLRCDKQLEQSYHIACEGEAFAQETDGVYRIGKVYRSVYDKKSGNLEQKELLQENHAKVMYEYPIDSKEERSV